MADEIGMDLSSLARVLQALGLASEPLFERQFQQLLLVGFAEKIAHNVFRELPVDSHGQQLSQHAPGSMAPYFGFSSGDGCRRPAIVQRAILDETIDGG